MLTTSQLLAAVKAAQGVTSNAGLARLVGVPEKSVYRWSWGQHAPDDATAARLAELAGLDPDEVVASINAERATDPAARAIWERIAKRLHATAAAVLAVVLSLWISGGPDGAAMASTPGASASAVPVNSQSNDAIHWRVFVSGLVRRLGRWLAGLIPGARLQGFAV